MAAPSDIPKLHPAPAQPPPSPIQPLPWKQEPKPVTAACPRCLTAQNSSKSPKISLPTQPSEYPDEDVGVCAGLGVSKQGTSPKTHIPWDHHFPWRAEKHLLLWQQLSACCFLPQNRVTRRHRATMSVAGAVTQSWPPAPPRLTERGHLCLSRSIQQAAEPG